MSALDASLLIAYFNPRDPHHRTATDYLLANADGHWVGSLTLAEVLVPHVAGGTVDALLDALSELGIGEMPLAEDAAVELARLLTRTKLKMPDCCVLLTAEQTGSAVASFDTRLRTAAVRLGIAVEHVEA